jgi:large subunit ribosomal protein L24
MQPKLHVRTDDIVEVTTGVYEGLRGRVLRCLPRDGKVVVEGVNVRYKHVKRNQRNQEGGRIDMEMPIDASNVMLVCENRECEKFDKPVRVRKRANEDGTKVRTCVKCGEPITPAE